MSVEKKTSVISLFAGMLFDNEGSGKAVLNIALSSFQLLNNEFPVKSDRNINNIKSMHGPDRKKDQFSPS